MGGVHPRPLRDPGGQKQKKNTETFRQKKSKVPLLMEEGEEEEGTPPEKLDTKRRG